MAGALVHVAVYMFTYSSWLSLFPFLTIYPSTYLQEYIYIYIQIYIYIIYTDMYMFMSMYMHTYYVNTYVYIYIRTHMQLRVSGLLRLKLSSKTFCVFSQGLQSSSRETLRPVKFRL